MLESERVFKFLARLNRELDRRPLPSTRELFNEVRHKERRRNVTLKEMHENDISALISCGPIEVDKESTNHKPDIEST